MTDRRWQVRSSCNHIVGSAGTPGISGTYCEVAPWDGKRMWVRFGTIGFANGIFWAATKWVMQFGGSVMYETTDEISTADGPVPTNWTTAVLGTDPAPVSTVSSGWSAVESNGFAKFSEDEDPSSGCIAKRKKLTSDIVFTGADWDFFLAIERDPVRRCEEITIRRQWRCDGMWDTEWTGTFSTGSGGWNYDTCEFTVRPDPLDAYTCIMDAMDQKVNILQTGTVSTEVAIGVTLEWGATADYHYPDPDPVCTGSVPQPSDVGDPAFGWVCAPSENFIDGDLYIDLTICVRERFQVECIDGIPSPPAGTGWVLLIDDCAVTGTATYVRPPEVPITFDPSTTDPACATGTSALVFPEYIINTPGGPCDGKIIHARYVCYTVDVVEYSTARLLQRAVEYMLEKAGCSINGVVSDFFEWDAPGDAPGYIAGQNYVTGQPNQMDQLVILHNSDAIDPSATNPATIGELTFGELFKLFAIGPRVFWRIDDLGRLRFEHWSYWTFPVGLSVLNYAAEDKSEPLSYAHLKEEVPKYERPKWMAARGKDFIGADIVYSGPCVGEEQKVNEYQAGRFVTDIEFVIDDPAAIGTDGFTLLACTFNGSVYSAIVGTGALSGNGIANAPLSWANLERDFWTWDRFLPSGNMNKVDTVFDGFVPNIEQRNVFVKLCCGYLDFDSSERVQTKLGDKLGRINAFVKRAEFDEATESVTLTLRYAY